MSLDDKVLDKKIVQLTLDGLETVYMASERIAEADSYPKDIKKSAFAYMREYDRCVMLERPSAGLRENFDTIAKVVVSKSKSPVHETFNYLTYGCAGAAVYSLLRWWADSNAPEAHSWISMAFFGVVGMIGTRALRDYFDNLEYRNLKKTAKMVSDAPDSVWAEALSRIHDKKFQEYK